MKIGPDSRSRSDISTSTHDQIVVRGHDLAVDLIGKVSFTAHAWLLATGELPSKAQETALDACLVAIAEHGLVPSVQASRMTYAAAPEAFQGAVAAGLLGCGSVILGAAEDAARFFTALIGESGLDEARVRDTLTEMRANKKPIPGYGHPLHKAEDPRTKRLREIGQEAGLYGPAWEAADLVAELIPEIVGRRLTLNVSGAIPALMLSAGYPMLAMKGVPLLARAASLIAHLLEERSDPIGFALSEAASEAIVYGGKLPSHGPLSARAAE